MAALTPEGQQRLSTQSINDGEPGTVVRDFETLLAFIGDNTPTVSPKHDLLSMGSLAPLNAPMTRPMQLSLQRPQQRAYAYLHALYLVERIDPIVRAMRKARMLESHGKVPVQYPGTDDWEA